MKTTEADRLVALFGRPVCGGTKKQEYLRTIELLDTIYEEQGLYFVLAFLYDSQYDRKDIHEMMELLAVKLKRKKENEDKNK